MACWKKGGKDKRDAMELLRTDLGSPYMHESCIPGSILGAPRNGYRDYP